MTKKWCQSGEKEEQNVLEPMKYFICILTGNLIADAMVNYWVVDMGPSTTGWSDAAVAIYPSAGIAEPSIARGTV